MKRILLSGPLLSNSGYGVHSRQVFSYLNSLKNVKIFCNILNWGNLPWHLSDEYTSNTYNNIIENYVPESQLANLKFEESYTISYPHEWLFYGIDKNIGITAGVETDIVPFHWLKYINKADQVICTSKFTAEAFYNTAKIKEYTLNKKIDVVYQHYYDEFKLESLTSLSLLENIKTKNNLLLIGQITDINKDSDRKNLFNSVESLIRILSKVEDAGLIIKTNVGNNSYLDFVKLKKMFSKYRTSLENELGNKIPKIYLLHGNMKPLELKSLYSSDKVSALVSLSKGEGFGLTLLEAASCGLPIIATNYSAYTEFLNDSFIKIDFKLENLPSSIINNKVFCKDAKWAIYKNKSLHMNVLKFFNNKDLYYNISKDLQVIIENNFDKESVFLEYKLCLN
jgi:glycosyltransferase involved in cell wall biosynthesis